MKLSKNTVNALKYLSTVNNSIMIRPQDGDDEHTQLYSKSDTHGFLVSVIIDEKFNSPFITSNLPMFLADLALFDDPDLEFTEDYVSIKSNNHGATFIQSAPHLVEAIQTNKLPKEQKDITMEFSLNEEEINKIMKACDILNISNIQIYEKGGSIMMKVVDPEVDSSNTFEIELNSTKKPTEGAKLNFKKINFRMRPTSYVCKASESGLLELTAQDGTYVLEKVFIVAEEDAE